MAAKPYDKAIFDVQAHAIKPSTLDAVTSAVRNNSALTLNTGDIIIHDVCKKLADDLQGPDRLKALGRDGVQVITINTFFPPLPPQMMLKIVLDLNTWMVSRTSQNSQLIGIASIPPPPALSKAGLAEDGETFATKGVNVVRHAITELGLKGIFLASNYEGVFLGDSVFDPYFALAEELDVPVIIHPAVDPVDGDFIRRKNIPTYSGYLNDQRTAILDLVFAGTFEKYPGITIIATHLGGGILTSLGRFKALTNRFPTDPWYIDLDGKMSLLPKPIEDYFKQIYYDCNNADVPDIIHAASIVGFDHLLTGSDFPWTDDTFTREVLGQLDESIQSKIAYENAAKLFRWGET